MSPIRDRARGPPGRVIPDTRALPDVGLSKPARTRRSVVFPAPFGPNSARQSPGASEKVTPATARVDPNSRTSCPTSTIDGADGSGEFANDIRLELATLAREAQNAVSLRLRQLGGDQPIPAMTDIDVLLTETRKFQPPPDFTRPMVTMRSSGPSRRESWSGSSRGRRFSSGSLPMRSGLPAES